MLLVLFFFFFGAGYEFVKCYKNRKNKNSESSGAIQSGYDETEEPRTFSQISQRFNSVEQGICLSWKDILIITLLIVIGIAVQPFFLIYKWMEMMMDCYRNYGCLVFWFMWGNNN